MVMVAVGRWSGVTAKDRDRLLLWPFGLVTVTVRGPNLAVGAITRPAVSDEGLPYAQEAVMSAPKSHVAPGWKPAPVMLAWSDCPCSPFPGDTADTLGGGCTVKPLGRLALCALGSVTVTVRVPGAAPVSVQVPFAVKE